MGHLALVTNLIELFVGVCIVVFVNMLTFGWWLIDWLAQWLGTHMTAKNQLRLGIIAVLLALPLALYGPFSNEQLLIYEMSAVALMLSGVCIVVSGVQSLSQEAALSNKE